MTSTPPQGKTFAKTLSNSFNFPPSQLPTPCTKGGLVLIKISEDKYKEGLQCYKNILHGRIILTKGSPLRRDKLAKLWKPIDPWKVIPLGKGFYKFSFASIELSTRDVPSLVLFETLEDVPSTRTDPQEMYPLLFSAKPKQRSQAVKPLILCELGYKRILRRLGMGRIKIILRLCRFEFFDKGEGRHKRIQAVSPLFFWKREKRDTNKIQVALFEITTTMGTPISLEDSTRSKAFRHYARLLVDVDLAKTLPEEVMVERESYAFLYVHKFTLVVSKSNKKKMKKNENPSTLSVSTKPQTRGGSLKSAS
ncbi:hypothetical protein HKD37_08G023313 [Glycine soja]